MPLELPATFAFSPSSLQAYEDCARRFWFAYVQRLLWPAVEAGPLEEMEAHIRLGSAFHQLLQRAENGIDPDLLAQRLEGDLAKWFDLYRQHRPRQLPNGYKEVEGSFSIPFGNIEGQYRLAAKYDLIAAEPGGTVMIVDWKTNRRRPRRSTLERRLQTIVYPFVLVEVSAALPWGPVEPEQVEMIYWFTADSNNPEIFHYSADQHAANRTRLQQMATAILSGSVEADFPVAPDTEENRQHLCAYCVYRSRCDRGSVAGSLAALEDSELYDVESEEALEFTLGEVEELAF